MAGFCARAEAMIASVVNGSLTDPEFSAQRHALVMELADVFQGRNPVYRPIAGYHGITLPAKLRADLGDYYVARQSAYDGDPVAVLFDWLLGHIGDGMAKGHGDDAVLASVLAVPLKYTNEVLRGVERRQRPPSDEDELALPDLD